MQGDVHLLVRQVVLGQQHPFRQDPVALVQAILQHRHRIVRQPAQGRLPTGQPFQRGAHFISRHDLADVIGAHRIAALGQMLQQAFVAQGRQRRAHRRARHPQFLGQRDFFQTGARAELAVQHPVPQRIGNVLR
ncbi:hypothetical protein D3C71_1664200 [compost metagenome]